MKNIFQYTIATVFVLTSFQSAFAQKKDENIGTEVVNVVKPYSPTISDAFKVKETPSFDDDETSKKENIKYNIFSFPVASTFTPNKGKAASVEKSAQEKLYNNYITLGAGNYGTANVELFVTENVSNTDYFGGMLRHLSSQGGIKNVTLDDKFSNTSLDLTYGSRTRALSWNADAGYQHQIYNWYGILPNYFDQAVVNAIDEQQTYHNLYVAGRLNLGESFLKESTIKLNRFWDAFGSAENRFIAKPSMEFDIVEEKINVDFILDYISGSFEKDFFGGSEIKYGFTNLGFQPSIRLQKDDLSIKDIVQIADYEICQAINLNANSFFILSDIPIANRNDFVKYNDFLGVISKIETDKKKLSCKVYVDDINSIFDRNVILTNQNSMNY
jgi:hypothetical protein